METLPDYWSESEAQLCKNIEALLDLYRWTQADFAAKLGRSQPWVSKRMSKKPEVANKWKVEDLDALAQVFQVTAYDLLRPGQGPLDRRSLHARRTRPDRRAAYSQGVTGASPHLDAVAATDHAILTANRLFELAESLHAAADAILRRHAATVGDLPPERRDLAAELGESTGGTSTKKTG